MKEVETASKRPYLVPQVSTYNIRVPNVLCFSPGCTTQDLNEENFIW